MRPREGELLHASLFSLALFPVLLALLESESRAPRRRIWFSVPLLALWGNLHGEELAGLGLFAARDPRLVRVAAKRTAVLYRVR